MPKRRPYLERATLERAAANLWKTTQLFEKREYSMTVVRAATVVELYLDGILSDRMTHTIRQERNEVVHRGTFSKKATAERAMNLAVSIVRKVNRALKVRRG